MPYRTLIATLPNGTITVHRTYKNYAYAVVYRCTVDEVLALHEEQKRVRASVTPKQRAAWEKLMVDLREVGAHIMRELHKNRADVAVWKERVDRGEDAPYPKMPYDDLWGLESRLKNRIRRHPLYKLESVDGMNRSQRLVKLSGDAHVNIGRMGVVYWGQSLELTNARAEAERKRHPHREIQVVACGCR